MGILLASNVPNTGLGMLVNMKARKEEVLSLLDGGIELDPLQDESLVRKPLSPIRQLQRLLTHLFIT